MDLFLKQISSCQFPIEKLWESLSFVQYGISERAINEVVGVPMLRMLNLQGGEWDLSDLEVHRDD